MPAAPSRPRGPRWSTRAPGTSEALHAIFGTGRGDVWIGGEEGTLLRTHDGGRTFARATVGEAVVALWGAGPDDVWVLGRRHLYRVRQGNRLARLSVEADFHRLWGTSPADVWIAAGVLVHTADGGTTFTRADPDPRTRRTDDVWASATAGVWATVPFSVVHSADAGKTWAHASLPVASEDDFRLRGSATDAWIVGYRGGPWRSTDGGLTWRDDGPPPVTDVTKARFWVDLWSTGDRAWAVTSDAIWARSEKAPWARVLKTPKVEAVWASGPDDVWAVGDAGLVVCSP
ncbi:MAG TPA: hypothetical protein VHS09_08265 [Polyangiaceae bacterium]|nr:hypothetical protein [Polyangiaceae bacterium]